MILVIQLQYNKVSFNLMSQNVLSSLYFQKMKHFISKIEIEYEGTPFVGWQIQKNGLSIQEVIQKAIFNFSFYYAFNI